MSYGGYDPNTATFAEKKAFYEKLSSAKKDQKQNFGGKKAGGTTLPCQQKGRATVYVSDSKGSGVAKVSATLSGGKSGKTDGDGAASFNDLDPKSYTAQIALGYGANDLDGHGVGKSQSQRVGAQLSLRPVGPLPQTIVLDSGDAPRITQDCVNAGCAVSQEDGTLQAFNKLVNIL